MKLQYGEYVSLGKVEAELKTSTLVDNICVYADPTKLFPVCLLVPNPDHLKAMAEKSKITHCFSTIINQLCSYFRWSYVR